MFKFLTFLVFFCFGYNVVPANADWGTKMLAFKCDANNEEFIIQPFVQWNNNYSYEGIKFDVPELGSSQFLDGYQFVLPDIFKKNEFYKNECELKDRRIKVFFVRGLVTIVDLLGDKSWAKEIDISNSIGSAWDVYGPLYKIKTKNFKEWDVCTARGDVADSHNQYKCTPLAKEN
jgi:hypothetical protein